MHLTVIGTGYVGLVAGAGFASFGNDVICADINAAKIARLKQGEIPLYEPALEPLVIRNVAQGRLQFSEDIAAAVARADVVFIAVGTPQGSDGAADMTAVLAVAETIGRAMAGPLIVVTKSTVPVGTADLLREVIGAHAAHPFSVVSNPEFLKEGDAVNDFMKPDRVLIGTDDEHARKTLAHLYAPFVRTNDRLHFMDARSAELTKYASNAMLAVRVSFMNEMADMAEKLGADIEQVRRGLGADPRIGPKFLFPGVGYGGSCFPKDLRALLHVAQSAGIPLEIIAAAERANARQKELLANKIARHFGGDLAGRTIALWGLAFKPNTDDIRDAPALAVIERLRAAGARLVAHDPAAMPNVRDALGDKIQLAPGMYEALEGADALALVTEWTEYRRPDLQRMKGLLRHPVLFDGRNVWDPAMVRAEGFVYHGIGRPASAG
jgi:UDPglucose 6-dehydrogenase